MRSRSGLLIALVACSMQAAPALAAKKPPRGAISDLVVTPKQPKSNQSIVVSFKAGVLPRDRRYDVSLTLGRVGGCSGGYAVRVAAVVPRGRRVTVRFYPTDLRGSADGAVPLRFCAGGAFVAVGHAGAAGRVVRLAGKSFQVAASSGSEVDGVPAKYTVLEGSSIVVRAPGRPDRSIALTGGLRGYIPGAFRPNTDITVLTTSGGLWTRSLQVDSLCAAGPILTDFPLARGNTSTLLLKASGEATLSLALNADPASFAGCPGGAAPTTLVLTGKVTPDGLLKLPLSGSLEGVGIAPGVTATVTISLLLNVDLSGKS